VIPDIEFAIDYMKQQFMNNQFFVGMLFTTVIAMGWATLRGFPSKIWNWFISRFTTYTNIYSDDPMFYYFSKWLSEQNFSQRNRIFNIRSLLVWDELKKSNDPTFIFTVGYARYLFRCNGKLTIIVKGKEDGDGGSSSTGPSNDMDKFFKRDSISIRYLGRNLNFIRDIMAEVADLYSEQEEEKLSIKVTYYSEWKRHKYMDKCNLNNICLKEGVLDSPIKKAFIVIAGFHITGGICFMGHQERERQP